jgi:thiosulfate/3-mercaptopyruvate sulfurtransferase
MTTFFPALPPVVEGGWVESNLGTVVLADVRWYLDGSSGHDAYLTGHLPGAIWVDLDTVLSDPPSAAGGRHPLPDPERFARALGELGIGNEDQVIAYDDQGGGFAARLVWLLRRTGQQAALLDGGLGRWQGLLVPGSEMRPPVRRNVRRWPAELIRDADQVECAARSPRSVVFDARARERYTGAERLPSETRTGHIPGAVSAPWADNLDATGRFASPETLRARFVQLGAVDTDEVIVYCGSGVTACHDLLALEYAGLRPGALFPGSWSAWSVDTSRAVAVGPDPVAPAESESGARSRTIPDQTDPGAAA